jgi:hypothetical protein
LLDDKGNARHFPSREATDEFARRHLPVGFDDRGRLLVQSQEKASITAIDLDTGEMQQIYP